MCWIYSECIAEVLRLLFLLLRGRRHLLVEFRIVGLMAVHTTSLTLRGIVLIVPLLRIKSNQMTMGWLMRECGEEDDDVDGAIYLSMVRVGS